MKSLPFTTRCVATWILGLGLIANPLTARAQDYTSPRITGLAGAGRAGPVLTDALYLNPSMISFNPTFGISGSYSGFGGRIIHASIIDGRNEIFNAGVGYTQRMDGPMIHLGASKAFIQRWGVGLGSKIFLQTDRQPIGAVDMTLSSVFIATPWLQLSLIIDNLIESDNAKLRNLHRQWILAAKFNVMGILLLYVDPSITPSLSPLEGDSFGWSVGAEITLMSDFYLRGGWLRSHPIPAFNGRRGSGFGVGAGWMGPKISIDYGYENVQDASNVFAGIHTAGLTVYF